jgi:hypothetical protein
MDSSGQSATIIDVVIGQVIGLVTFFLFPAAQYIFLKRISKKEGNPQLWYLPDYGFRLVIRNKPRNKILKDIKYNILIRKIIPPTPGSSVRTYIDETLSGGESLLIPPKRDKVLLSFKLNFEYDDIQFILTDKLGCDVKKIPLNYFDKLVIEYYATIVNYFNFNIQIMKGVEIPSQFLKEICRSDIIDDREKQIVLNQEFVFNI